MRDLESYLYVHRPKGVRKADDFSRPYGIPFTVAGGLCAESVTNRIPVTWSEEVVAFSIAPVVRGVQRQSA